METHAERKSSHLYGHKVLSHASRDIVDIGRSSCVTGLDALDPRVSTMLLWACFGCHQPPRRLFGSCESCGRYFGLGKIVCLRKHTTARRARQVESWQSNPGYLTMKHKLALLNEVNIFIWADREDAMIAVSIWLCLCNDSFGTFDAIFKDNERTRTLSRDGTAEVFRLAAKKPAP